MRIVICVSLFSCWFRFASAQNLVPNPSFEQYSSCPSLAGDLDHALGWTSFRGTPDYFNSCNSFGLGVPINAIGHQFAISGNAYAGAVTYLASDTNVREHIGIQLLQPMIIGKRYYTSLFVSRTDTFSYDGASNNIGMRFSTLEYNVANPSPIDNFSHVHADTLITNKDSWTKVTGSFVADSTYWYVILGNFYNDATTDTFQCAAYAYYYIDGICVTDDSLFNSLWSSNDYRYNSEEFIYYPNPASSEFIVEANEKLISVELFDAIGRKVLEEHPGSNKSTILIERLDAGLYIAAFTSAKLQYIGKITITR